MLSDINKRTISYLLYDGNKNYDRFDHVKEVFKNNEILKSKPEYFSMRVEERLNHELKGIQEIISLYKKGILIQEDIPFINYVIPYSHPIDSHFSVFRNTIQIFGNRVQNDMLSKKVDSLEILGSCLIGEYDASRNKRTLKFSETKTIAELDSVSKKIVLKSKDGITKLCSYFSYFSTHVIVFAKLLIDTKEFGIHAFLVPLRDPKTNEINKNIDVTWLGRNFGNASYRNYTLKFNDLELPFDALLTQDDLLSINASKVLYDRSLNVGRFKFVIMLEAFRESRLALRNLFKAIYLATKYNDMRTQFKTIDNSKDERKIFEYQQNKTRITEAFIEAVFLLIGFNNLSRTKGILLTNIYKNQERIEQMCTFAEAFKAYVSRRSLYQIQILRESCGGWGFMQFSGLPAQVESAVMLVNQEANLDDKIIEYAMFFLGKHPNPEATERFIRHYYQHYSSLNKYTELHKELLEKDFNLDNLYFLGSVLNLRTTWLRKTFTDKYQGYNLGATRSKIKSDPEIYNSFLEFGETLISSYCFIHFMTLIIFKPYRGVNPILNLVLHTTGLNTLTKDPEFLKHFKEKKSAVEICEIAQKKKEDNISDLAKTLPSTVDGFEYDENCLNCIVGGDPEKFYKDVYDWIRFKNLRNKPGLHDEITTPLRNYLNRKGAAPNL